MYFIKEKAMRMKTGVLGKKPVKLLVMIMRLSSVVLNDAGDVTQWLSNEGTGI